MDERFADWYRISDPDPRSETLVNRWAVIEKQAKAAGVILALDLVRLFTGTRQSEVASATDFVAAFKAADPALPMRENDKLIQVLAGATLSQALEYEDPVADAAALALRSVQFAGYGRSGAFPDLMEDVEVYLVRRARDVRAEEEEDKSSASKLAKQLENIAFPKLDELSRIASYQHYAQANEAFGQIESHAAKVAASFAALRSAMAQLAKDVAALAGGGALRKSREWRASREELNILWWLFGESSRDLELPASTVTIDAFAIIAGKELADLTTHVPGVVAAEAMLHRALRATGGMLSTPLSLKSAVEATSEDWRRGFVASADAAPDHLRELAPVHFAVRRSLEDGNAWPATFRRALGLKRDPKISAVELANQIYTERLLARAIQTPE